jgi:hypothetical protein
MLDVVDSESHLFDVLQGFFRSPIHLSVILSHRRDFSSLRPVDWAASHIDAEPDRTKSDEIACFYSRAPTSLHSCLGCEAHSDFFPTHAH